MLKQTLCLLGALTLFGPQLVLADPLALNLPSAARSSEGARHVLNRLAFGPRPFEVAQVAAMGVDRWILEQLHPAQINEPEQLVNELAGLPTLTASDAELFRHDAALARDKSDAGKAERGAFVKTVIREAQIAHLDRALMSNRQLQEVLVGFWFNHFNVYVNKGYDHVWASTFENEAIRPHVFGHFRTLLEATARHPAMLFYFDNWQNSAPGSPTPRGKESGLNENYARELMELHTLGVDGGYTQKDVTELARILTGWGLRDRAERGAFRGAPPRQPDFTLAFDPARHDFGDKTLLGTPIKGSGWQEVEQALDILAASPATARHLSFQLAQYFVADQPDPQLVEQMSRTYLRTGGDLTAVLVTMIESPAFWSEDTVGRKFKTPFEYAVSSLRAVNVVPHEPQPIFGFLRELGQPLYGIETPDGYKQVQSAWLNPDAMARRLSFATNLGQGRLNDQRIEINEASIRSVLPPVLLPQTDQALAQSDGRLRAALLLGSPDFMMR